MRRLASTAAAVTAVMVLGGTASAFAQVTGPDVADYQHPYGASIDWNQVASPGGASFTAIKAAQGTSYTNPYYAQDAAQAHAAGLYVAAYDFADPAGSAVAEADYFVSQAGGVAALDGQLELPPLLDLETTGGLSPAALVTWTQQWLNEVQRLTGRTPMIYTYPTFWSTSMGNSTAFGNYPLWIADYGSTPVVPPGWGWWTFWQYTDNASVPGISSPADMNYFNGSLARLQALATPPAVPPVTTPPFGHLDVASLSAATLTAAGWAEDPAAPMQALTVTMTVDGATASTATASGDRPDVARVYPAGGPYHGFALTAPAPTTPGDHTVCVDAENAAGTATAPIGCQTVSVVAPQTPKVSGLPGMPAGTTPVGYLDSVTAVAPGVMRIAGWSIDPTTSRPIRVEISLNGSPTAYTGAGTARPDVARVYPTAGQYHGFVHYLQEPPGTYRICASGVGYASGASAPLVGCKSVTIPVFGAPGAGMPAGHNPIGYFDTLTSPAPGVMRLTGWSIDPDTLSGVNVHIYVDGVGTRAGAGTPRPDVQRVYPGAGEDHGFDLTFTGTPGTHRVCVYAINAGPGTANPLLGCKSITIR